MAKLVTLPNGRGRKAPFGAAAQSAKGSAPTAGVASPGAFSGDKRAPCRSDLAPGAGDRGFRGPSTASAPRGEQHVQPFSADRNSLTTAPSALITVMRGRQKSFTKTESPPQRPSHWMTWNSPGPSPLRPTVLVSFPVGSKKRTAGPRPP